MLLHLKIRDFAIIDEVEVEFGSGFTVVTGETGAGKSILVDALMIALGGKANGDIVRNGCEFAEVEALFDIASQTLVQARLAERELVGDDSQVLLIRRVIGAKGRAKVIINGRLSTLATLGEIVRGLVDISGQHEQQTLLHVDGHINILDSFGQLDDMRDRYKATYKQWLEAATELESLRNRTERDEQRADFVKFQLDEIERVTPRPGEDDELAAEQRKLAGAHKLKSGVAVAESLLYGEDGSAFDKLGKAAAELEALARIDDELVPIRESLNAAQRDLQEAARTLQRYMDRIDDDSIRLASVEDRLDELRRLARKHGGSIADVLAKRGELERETLGLENTDTRAAELEKLIAERGTEARVAAKELSIARHKAAAKMDVRIRKEISEMDLAGAIFETRFTSPYELRRADVGAIGAPTGAGTESGAVATAKPAASSADVSRDSLGPLGFDAVEFLWGPNRGEQLRPLARIASGGELSRLMLAVKTVLASRDLVSLYVFDEVDTGLGGRAADAIGKKIQAVARGHQAITITHLAPIAARADVHICVRKETIDAVDGDGAGPRTVSVLEKLTGAARATEIARMIDGASESKATRQAAKDMLARAAAA
ncbi:MAG: DNA repair protein RecN [Clostridia bacterium]|nr:DNA repair protein RecN [Deltaproteobacteria bacterium]